MRHLAEARRPPKAEVASSVAAAAVVVCLLVSTQRGRRSPYVWNSLDFRAVVLLGFAMVSMLTWFRPLVAAPAAGPRLTDTYCSLSLSLSCMAKEKLTQSVCLEKRVKWLHSVSSSDSFISKPGARQEVPPRGVSNSDLVDGLFYLNNSLYFYVIVRLIYEFSRNGSAILHFHREHQFQRRDVFSSAESPAVEGSRNSLKLMMNEEKLFPHGEKYLHLPKILITHRPLEIINLD